MRSGRYHSKGKFLLSGEYFVLCGAKALAVPLKFGQHLVVEEISPKGRLRWSTVVQGQPWFKAEFHQNTFELLDSTDDRTGLTVQCLLREGRRLQPRFDLEKMGYSMESFIDFDLQWGLGSSSSMVSNLASWLDVDPFALYRSTYQGSGFDVYCARAKNPILYRLDGGKPEVREISFRPPFADKLYFVYLGRKQDSQESVRHFRADQFANDKIISEISGLTEKMVTARTLEDFMKVMNDHENKISAALGMPVVGREIFPDFSGAVKSLGAWGGDFVMAASAMKPEDVTRYFKGKGKDVIFRWQEMVER